MNIAVVDDVTEERNNIMRHISECLSKTLKNTTLNFTEFPSGLDLLEEFKPGYYQIIFLDIYLDHINGIQVARQLLTLDPKTNIIFYTSSKEHILDGYEVQACGYVLKPIQSNDEYLKKALFNALGHLGYFKSSLSISTKYGDKSVFYDNIRYLDMSARKLYLHLTNSSIQIYEKYAFLATKLLQDSRFIECYRNIIVNIEYINTPLENDFLMKNGEKIPISRRRKAEVMDRYISYFLHERLY